MSLANLINSLLRWPPIGAHSPCLLVESRYKQWSSLDVWDDKNKAAADIVSSPNHFCIQGHDLYLLQLSR